MDRERHWDYFERSRVMEAKENSDKTSGPRSATLIIEVGLISPSASALEDSGDPSRYGKPRGENSDMQTILEGRSCREVESAGFHDSVVLTLDLHLPL